MAWGHLSINKPDLVYIILGSFTTLFMLCSSIIKERLYLGEPFVATLCGIIFGPHAANIINPLTWGNTDQITLEFSRIVLVVQCFAFGIELPRGYLKRHLRSVFCLLIPVMTFGWLVTGLSIWAMFQGQLKWLDSLTCAACVTATDPVLAASAILSKGKFSRRVPKHLRDLLTAESGCNDGMCSPFIFLALYLLRYQQDAAKVAKSWLCITILYQCIFGAFYGIVIGYLARRAIRYAHREDLIDRESFLAFYFVLALFCAGSGSLLGIDDSLIGFFCGVSFGNDGWFQEKAEESHVANVIDLLMNLTFFVYFGTIIPWDQFNTARVKVWKLVAVAFLVLFLRRIPIMVMLKPLIPDLKTWREALFAGHFGPIGAGAIFATVSARAYLETTGNTPLAVWPDSEHNSEHDNIIEMIWPITTFLVLTSVIVHGSSITLFTFGKRMSTIAITMSYTISDDGTSSWLDRLPRVESQAKSTMSLQDGEQPEDPTRTLPRNFLRRQREEDTPAPKQAHHRPLRSDQTTIVEDEDGKIIKNNEAPQPGPERRIVESSVRSGQETLVQKARAQRPAQDLWDYQTVRLRVDGIARRMTKAEFTRHTQDKDPNKRACHGEQNDEPQVVGEEARGDAAEQMKIAEGFGAEHEAGDVDRPSSSKDRPGSASGLATKTIITARPRQWLAESSRTEGGVEQASSQGQGEYCSDDKTRGTLAPKLKKQQKKRRADASRSTSG